MSRCIDADALKKKIRKDYHPTDEIPFFEIMHIISDAPTIEERPKGRWIYHKSHSESRECSNCGVWLDWSLVRNSFCPNCGADMRGDV